MSILSFLAFALTLASFPLILSFALALTKRRGGGGLRNSPDVTTGTEGHAFGWKSGAHCAGGGDCGRFAIFGILGPELGIGAGGADLAVNARLTLPA